nr:MAG TPA: hypothetical protein [Caudoviricetes sp.]
MTMKRDILFRGKGAGVWRYGSYVHFDKQPIRNVIILSIEILLWLMEQSV